MNNTLSTEFDVFLSHNSRNKDTVRKLAENLQARGLKVWFDEWELIPGRPWREALELIATSVRVAVVLVANDGIGPWQDRETSACLSEFVERNMPVIPVLLPGAPQKVELPLFLKQFTWVDLRDGLYDEGIDRLVWGITGKKPLKSTRTSPGLRTKYSDTELLHLMWDYLDAPLQDAFALAYNKKRREGKNRISTRDLFQALVLINDPTVSRLFASLPNGALPEPPESTPPIDDSVLNEVPTLSDCVAESLTHFENVKSHTRKISSADLFVDIGRHGHGSTVQRLRSHGVSANDIQGHVKALGMVVLTRSAD